MHVDEQGYVHAARGSNFYTATLTAIIGLLYYPKIFNFSQFEK